MSWLIQTLLLKKEDIKGEADLESDEFNDLILIEKSVSDLAKRGILLESDLEVLGFKFAEGTTPPEKMSRADRLSYYRKFETLCDRIAYYMGGCFTDEGYLEYMRKKYKLSSEQLEKLQFYMNSKFKYQNMRKPIKNHE